jgi:hypothetical protein
MTSLPTVNASGTLSVTAATLNGLSVYQVNSNVVPVQAATSNGMTITGTVTVNQGSPLAATILNAWPVNVVSSTALGMTITSMPAISTTPGTTISTVGLNLTPLSPTFATVGVASTQIATTNTNRKGIVLTNTSVNKVSFGLANAPAVLNSGITINASGGVWVMDQFTFTTGAINAIASGASSNVTIQEFNT